MTMAGTTAETKLRGGYYTPPLIAEFLVRWATQDRAERILEPSAGDGAFVHALRSQGMAQTRIDAIELSNSEAAKIPARPADSVVVSDSFSWFLEKTPDPYDAVVGNPPF